MRKLIISVFIALFCAYPALAQEVVKDGINKTYFPTGEVQYESMYKGGKLNGITKEYDKSGKLIKVHVFKNDQRIKTTSKVKEKSLEIGKLNFLHSIWFWIVVVIAVGVVWFIFVKTAFKNRPF